MLSREHNIFNSKKSISKEMKDIKKEFFIKIPIFLRIFNIKGEQQTLSTTFYKKKKNKKQFSNTHDG
jgi:hypothetical protein